MPIEYNTITYGCRFKCGQRHTKYKKLMEAHEERCWSNPDNKSCSTCKHKVCYFDKDVFDDDEPTCSYPGEGWFRDCKIGEFTEDNYTDGLMYYDDGKTVRFIKPKVNCDKWESKIPNKGQ